MKPEITAVQAIKNADLDGALQALKDQVRKAPDVAKHRTFLFQLFAVLGDWDRALTQLNVARDLDPEVLSMAQTYQEALHCEVLRARVFSGQRSPLIFGEPEPWVAILLESLRMQTSDNLAQASELRQKAFDMAPAIPGTITTAAHAGDESATVEQPFAWIADADSRLGPVLEAIVNGKYYWIPFGRISQVEVVAPADLRDIVWTPATFLWQNGGQAVGLIPTRYPGSEQSTDDMIRMSRKTEWTEVDSDTYFGLGQRLFTTDVDDYPLMDIRKIQLEPVDEAE